MITKFYTALHDGISDSFGLDPNVLTTLLTNAHGFSADQPRLSPKMRQIALEATSGGWMDASGVERYLRDKRVIFETFTDSLGGSNYQVSSSLNLSTFLKCEIFPYYRYLSLLIYGLQIFPMSLYVLVMDQHSHGDVWKRHSAWQLSTPSGILILWVAFDIHDIYTCASIIMTKMNLYLAFHSLHTAYIVGVDTSL